MSGAGGVTVHAVVRGRGVETELEVPVGSTLALLGPNGTGKSTTLDVIAGLLTPDRGVVRVGDRTLLDTAAGVVVPPHRRGIGLLRQEALLFPHLSARANVEFGPRAAGMSRRRAGAVADAALAAVGALDVAARRPAQLSGGQAQRVALARALAPQPRVLLLDEPFAALDVDAAPALRGVVRQVLREAGRTAVIVTHDVVDAVSLADRVAVIEGGRVVECGPTAAVLGAPRRAFSARLAGVNLLAGTMVSGQRLALPQGTSVVGVGGPPEGAAAVAVFAPSAVAVFLEPPLASPRNCWPVRVQSIEDRGGAVRVGLGLVSGERVAADVTAAAVAELGLAPGQLVHAVVKAQEVALHPAR